MAVNEGMFVRTAELYRFSPCVFHPLSKAGAI